MADIRVVHLLGGHHFGGAEQMVRYLAGASSRIGVESLVYCLAKGRFSSLLAEQGIRFREFPSAGRLDVRPLFSIARALKEDRADIIQAHTSRTHLIARFLSRRLGIPNITTIQSPIALDENQGTRRHPLRAWIERAGRRWTDHICPVSREETERLIGEEGVPADKITWIPNGIEAVEATVLPSGSGGRAPESELAGWLEGRSLPSDTFVVTMIASLRPRKGAEVLLGAFARFLGGARRGTSSAGGAGAAEPHAVLLIIGDDEFTQGKGYLERLRSLSVELGAAESVHFLGFQPEPWALARDCDLIVLPSLFGEGLPLTLLEAMNYARPVAASDIPGNRECVVDGESGWLHPPGDEAKLAEQIGAAAADPEAMRLMGSKGRALFLDQFELGGVLERWRAIYRKVLGPEKASVDRDIAVEASAGSDPDQIR